LALLGHTYTTAVEEDIVTAEEGWGKYKRYVELSRTTRETNRPTTQESCLNRVAGYCETEPEIEVDLGIADTWEKDLKPRQ
jgi:hypothetical protein